MMPGLVIPLPPAKICRLRRQGWSVCKGRRRCGTDGLTRTDKSKLQYDPQRRLILYKPQTLTDIIKEKVKNSFPKAILRFLILTIPLFECNEVSKYVMNLFFFVIIMYPQRRLISYKPQTLTDIVKIDFTFIAVSILSQTIIQQAHKKIG